MATDGALAEVFAFLRNERADVRKMAMEGLAANSMNNDALLNHLKETPDDVGLLLELLSIKEKPLLGQLLSTLVNVAAYDAVAELLSRHKCISRTIRLYDALQRSEDAGTTGPLQEMCMMLLNNLTASHQAAVDDLLQVDDEDLRGYSLGVLKTHYDRQPDDVDRTQKLWFLRVCLNITRCGEGQKMLVEEEDEWFEEVIQLIRGREPDPRLVAIALQIGHHCCAQKSLIPRVTARKLPLAIVERVQKMGLIPSDVQLVAMETLEAIMSDESGMQALEEVNAKKYLTTYADEEAYPREVREFVKQQLLPFLDDIDDVYVVNDAEED